MGSTFGYSGSRSSNPPLEIVDPDPWSKMDPDLDLSTYFSIMIFFLLIPKINNLHHYDLYYCVGK